MDSEGSKVLGHIKLNVGPFEAGVDRYHSNIKPSAGEETCQKEYAIVGKGEWANSGLYSHSTPPQHFLIRHAELCETQDPSGIAMEAAW